MSQEQDILEYLQDGNSLSPLEALQKFGCLRLSGRIFDLKKLGIDIRVLPHEKGQKNFARYYIKKA